MAGRGRGRTSFTFNVDSLGFGRGDALPSGVQAPSPLYPPMQFRPVPLHTGEEVEYMLALKQEYRASSKNLPFHIRQPRTKRDVARYSDKYQDVQNKQSEWNPDWTRLPVELCISAQKQSRRKTKPVIMSKSKPAVASTDVLHRLETLEKTEQENRSDEEGDEVKKKKLEEEEEDAEVADVYDEEECEEETDYISSYFDNGEDFGGDSDDNMDEAIY